jgi:hypothetical protein
MIPELLKPGTLNGKHIFLSSRRLRLEVWFIFEFFKELFEIKVFSEAPVLVL